MVKRLALFLASETAEKRLQKLKSPKHKVKKRKKHKTPVMGEISEYSQWDVKRQ
jgi:hypothetical protein